MSSAAFQAAFVRLVTDHAFRDAVRSGLVPETLEDPAERTHLSALAAQPGIAAMRVVYRSFRLNKILALLPLTGRVLGEQRLQDELEGFWQATPSGSFYYFEEAGRFCDYLCERMMGGALDVALLRDVLLYEQACIRLRHAASEGRRLVVQVDFEHDFTRFTDLVEGRVRDRDLAACPTAAWGVAEETGDVQWYVDDRGTRAPSESAARAVGPRDDGQAATL